MISPCTKVCVMDAENRYCLGCARTLAEIARWGEMTDEERAKVIVSLPLRSSLSSPEREKGSESISGLT